MKTLKWIGLVGAICLAALVVVVVLERQPSPNAPDAVQTPELTAEAQNTPITPLPERPVRTRTVVAAPTAPQVETVVPENGGAPVTVMRVQPGQTLASVNGVAIKLKDLVPLPAEKAATEQVMSAEMFNYLLNRAVEREATFQAATRQGVELTAAQRQRLAEQRARSEQPDANVFDTMQQNPANVAFEQRDSEALLLQAALAERAGVPSPHVTAARVQAYYQAHLAEYGALPADPAQQRAAWEKIDQAIRQTLAPQLQAEHQERLQQFVEQLKATAEIMKASPSS